MAIAVSLAERIAAAICLFVCTLQVALARVLARVTQAIAIANPRRIGVSCPHTDALEICNGYGLCAGLCDLL